MFNVNGQGDCNPINLIVKQVKSHWIPLNSPFFLDKSTWYHHFFNHPLWLQILSENLRLTPQTIAQSYFRRYSWIHTIKSSKFHSRSGLAQPNPWASWRSTSSPGHFWDTRHADHRRHSCIHRRQCHRYQWHLRWKTRVGQKKSDNDKKTNYQTIIDEQRWPNPER